MRPCKHKQTHTGRQGDTSCAPGSGRELVWLCSLGRQLQLVARQVEQRLQLLLLPLQLCHPLFIFRADAWGAAASAAITPAALIINAPAGALTTSPADCLVCSVSKAAVVWAASITALAYTMTIYTIWTRAAAAAAATGSTGCRAASYCGRANGGQGSVQQVCIGEGVHRAGGQGHVGCGTCRRTSGVACALEWHHSLFTRMT
eukprot:1162087-Pelagomonas_calceolata.AAC.11